VGSAGQVVRRPRWWTQILVIVWLCWVYDAVANLAPLRRQAARDHALSILHTERVLHIDPEAALDHWLAGHHALAVVVSNYYDNAHFVVTLGLVGWLWWSHPALYRPLRTALVLINVIGMAVFWVYPTAPPRLLSPSVYVDVVASTHAFGSWHAGTLATAANQLAAMPSLHIAWAVWSAYAVWLVVRGRGERPGGLVRPSGPVESVRSVRSVWLVWLYPVVTTFAVLSTGNHFTLDAVAGLLTFLVAMGMARYWPVVWNRYRRPLDVTTAS
jgi:hypothetical protein